ncbi:MAG: hypothetical protein Q8L89_04270 [Gammaproteobacteria bacterium]|nr:hypothetical protein [Gammaproteobacteria bacterium]
MTNIITKKRKLLPFEGQWLEAIGCPELTHSWIVYAESGHGKTTFTMQLCQYLVSLGVKVWYDTLEEGDSESFKQAILRTGMAGIGKQFMVLDKWPIEAVKDRLRKRTPPQVIIIDSIQYSGLRYADYQTLLDEFRQTMFVFISHADGSRPKGSVAEAVRFDAHVKIRVEGYKAFVNSRFRDGEGQPIVIWEEGASKYWAV